jgi:hypothetical protein
VSLSTLDDWLELDGIPLTTEQLLSTIIQTPNLHIPSPQEVEALLEHLDPEEIAAYTAHLNWLQKARPNQTPPVLATDHTPWYTWLVLAGRGFGKLVALETPIPTPDGWTTMGELSLGDTVFDEQGKPCRVTNIRVYW